MNQGSATKSTGSRNGDSKRSARTDREICATLREQLWAGRRGKVVQSFLRSSKRKLGNGQRNNLQTSTKIWRREMQTRLATFTMRHVQNILGLFSKGVCPHCSSSNVRFSRRKNDLEKVLSGTFWIRPLRCRDCHLRFWNWDRHKSKAQVTCLMASWAKVFLLVGGIMSS